jgi:Rrf2 family protein
MQLRNHVEWALHCCAILAGLQEGRYLPTKDLAEFHGVPKEYLSKAMQALSQAGIVESTLGPTGGYRLAKSPKAITFLDIVEAVEGKGPAFVCTEIRRNNPCLPAKAKLHGPCQVARVMWDAEEAWRAKLRSVSIADLLQELAHDVPQQQLTQIAAWVGERS